MTLSDPLHGEQPTSDRAVSAEAALARCIRIGSEASATRCTPPGAKLFVKQIGSNHALWPSISGKGEDPAQWPADLRPQ